MYKPNGNAFCPHSVFVASRAEVLRGDALYKHHPNNVSGLHLPIKILLHFFFIASCKTGKDIGLLYLFSCYRVLQQLIIVLKASTVPLFWVFDGGKLSGI
jgi:hypothetical protein